MAEQMWGDMPDELKKNVLLGAYHGQDLTLSEIAEHFEVTSGAIYGAMKKFGIPTKVLDLVSDEYLEKLHWDDKMTMAEIGDLFQCSKTTIHRYFEDNEIRKKGYYEANEKSLHPTVVFKRGYLVADSRIGRDDRKSFYVHRLTAYSHFDGDMDDFEDKQVHHRNKYKWDNRPRNLEVLSPQQHQAVHHMDEWAVDGEGEPVLVSPKYAEVN